MILFQRRAVRRLMGMLAGGAWALVAPSVWAATVPSAEKLLPDDTLAVVTVPDCRKLLEIYQKTPQSKLWKDPAMKTFREKFNERFQEELVRPLERELDVRLEDYVTLLQGQLTLAVTQNGWQGSEDQALGLLLLLDCRDKSNQLKTNLSVLRKTWLDAGKPLISERILNFEFSVLPVSSNDFPKTLKKFFPPPLEEHDIATEDQPKPEPRKHVLVFGQIDSLLIVGNSTRAVEKVVIRATGGAIPSLSEMAGFDLCRQAMFRDAPIYGWASVKRYVDVLVRRQAEKAELETPDSFALLNTDKLLTATGLNDLKTLAFNFRNTREGSAFQLFLGVPEASRHGLLKILAAEPKASSPPPFVPADAIKFQRWRIDGPKVVATLQKMLSDISPQWVTALSFLLDTANAAAQIKDPGFDLKKSLLANLGDDLVSYDKPPRSTSPADLASPPSIFLVGSPNPEQLAAALKSLLSVAASSSTPFDREFLGRKIYAVPLPSMPLPLGEAGKSGGPRMLSFAASGGYVAMSSQPAILEEFLRAAENPPKPLREVPGLADAMQKVIDPGTGWFGFENESETTRILFESLKKDPAAFAGASNWMILLTTIGLATAGKDISEWMDFSLLPDFEKVSRYFGFSVYGGSANVDGLTVKLFTPTPLALRPAVATAER